MKEELDRYFLGELSAAEKEALFDRVEADADYKAEFIRMQHTVALTGLFPHKEDAQWTDRKSIASKGPVKIADLTSITPQEKKMYQRIL